MAKPLLPTAYVNFKDGQLARGPLPSGLFVFVGVGDGSASMGVVTPVNSPNDVEGLFGTGPLARQLTSFFLEGGGFCYAIQVAGTGGTIDAPSVGGFTAGEVTGTVKNAYSIVVRSVVAGALGIAQVEYSLDGGETWGQPRVLKAGANLIVGPSGFTPGLSFTTTLATVLLTTANFTCSTVAPSPTDGDVTAAMDTAIQDASLFFTGFHIGIQKADTDTTVALATTISAKLIDAETTWFKYLYAIMPAPLDVATGASALAFAQELRADFASRRVQFCGQPMVIKSQGGQFVMNASPLVAARRAQLNPQNDLGIVSAGQLNSVVKYAAGWTDASIVGIDQVRNVVTIRRHVGVAGFYFTNDWMSDPTSDYRKSCFRIIADLVAADCRAAGMPFLKMDVDPDDVSGSAEILLAAARGPLNVRVASKQISRYELTVPGGQDILTTEELIVEVAIVPMGTMSWIKFNLGFKSPFAGG